ncbi:hypothetical protein C8R44DRAFT_732730 [Mycena epipterygia]|nr:hypothetical protein C8R44DRAFT_732730 [Mycena epipterygia]
MQVFQYLSPPWQIVHHVIKESPHAFLEEIQKTLTEAHRIDLTLTVIYAMRLPGTTPKQKSTLIPSPKDVAEIKRIHVGFERGSRFSLLVDLSNLDTSPGSEEGNTD